MRSEPPHSTESGSRLILPDRRSNLSVPGGTTFPPHCPFPGLYPLNPQQRAEKHQQPTMKPAEGEEALNGQLRP